MHIEDDHKMLFNILNMLLLLMIVLLLDGLCFVLHNNNNYKFLRKFPMQEQYSTHARAMS